MKRRGNLAFDRHEGLLAHVQGGRLGEQRLGIGNRPFWEPCVPSPGATSDRSLWSMPRRIRESIRSVAWRAQRRSTMGIKAE